MAIRVDGKAKQRYTKTGKVAAAKLYKKEGLAKGEVIDFYDNI